jgi:hypothetical protein
MTTLKEPLISDVIKHLESILKNYGDIPVRSSNPGGYGVTSDNLDIDLSEDETWLTIEGES